MYGYNPYQYGGMPAQRQELIRVNGLDGAKAFQMAGPGCTVAMFDANSDTFYIKQTDGAGFPTIRTFRFTEQVETPEQAQKEPAYGEILNAINELKEMIRDGKQPVSE